MRGDQDAVVVGSGPNGLAAAVTLAAAGLRVLVIEAATTPGGGCRTEELTLPGYRHDVCSAAHPLALASPFFRRFDLAARGVRLLHPPAVFAHPLDGGRAAIVTRSVTETAASLGADGPAYRRLIGPLADGCDDLAGALLSSMRRPPVPSAALAAFALRGLRSASSVAAGLRTPQARGLLAGAAAHAMMPLTAPPTAGVGLMLTAFAHGVGWPVVAGGSARITDAMLAAVLAAGGEIVTGERVKSLASLPPARAVLLDVTPRGLAGLSDGALPAGYARALARFKHAGGVCKVDFALAGPVPWACEAVRGAGTVHLGGTFEEIAAAEAEVAAGRLPGSPYVLVVQPGVADPDRAPDGGQTLWAYCHVPSGSSANLAPAVQAQIERFAPGFSDLVLASHVMTAADEEAANPNYVGGDITAGMQTLRQTFARPVARWNPYRTPLRGVYLCSASTPPGPGVHGRCGELAALTALRDVFGVRRAQDIGPAALPGKISSLRRNRYS